MSELTVAQVKDAKRELQQSIARMLEEFVDKTGVKVTDLELGKQETLGGEIVRYFVIAEVGL